MATARNSRTIPPLSPNGVSSRSSKPVLKRAARAILERWSESERLLHDADDLGFALYVCGSEDLPTGAQAVEDALCKLCDALVAYRKARR